MDKSTSQSTIYATETNYDVVILDLIMPDLHGYEVLQKVKRKCPRTKIIITSSMVEVSDRVLGLNSGADDYLCKIFDVEELVARIHSVCRRKGILRKNEIYRHKGYAFDVKTSTLKYRKEAISLTPNESLIMNELFRSVNIPISYKNLIKTTNLKGSLKISLNTLNVNIANIRRKIKPFDGPDLIHTIRTKGYMLKR